MVEAVTATMSRHLYHLIPELAMLTLFAKDISEWEREKMAARLLQFPRQNQFHGSKPAQPNFQPPQAAHLATDWPML